MCRPGIRAQPTGATTCGTRAAVLVQESNHQHLQKKNTHFCIISHFLNFHNFFPHFLQFPVLSSQFPVPSSQFPVPSSQYFITPPIDLIVFISPTLFLATCISPPIFPAALISATWIQEPVKFPGYFSLVIRCI